MHHHSTADLENLGDSAPLVHGSSASDVLPTGFGGDGAASATEMLTADQIDAILMRHDQVTTFTSLLVWKLCVSLATLRFS